MAATKARKSTKQLKKSKKLEATKPLAVTMSPVPPPKNIMPR